MHAVSFRPSLTGPLVGLAVAATLTWMTPGPRPAPSQPEMVRPPECVLPLARPALTPIDLEWRTVEASLDVPAWQQFIYTRDASARQAFASEAYRASETRDRYQMMQDEYGGVWAVRDGVFSAVSAGEAAPMRDVWLLPHNAAFRGVVDRL